MANKKKLGDCKKVFRFNPGVSAPIVNRDGEKFDPGCGAWESTSKMPSTEENLLKNSYFKDGREYRVIKGYDLDGVVKYLLQHKEKAE